MVLIFGGGVGYREGVEMGWGGNGNVVFDEIEKVGVKESMGAGGNVTINGKKDKSPGVKI